MDRIDVRAMRRRHGWTQQEMAEYLGVDRSTVSRLEAGQTPTGSTEKLLTALEAPEGGFARAAKAAEAKKATLHKAIVSRLAELAACAAEERIETSASSNADLWRFLATHPGARPPALYLLENGNYRAMWWNDRGEQLGLQFRGNGEVQYVLFAKRDDAPGGMGRSSGRDGFRGIERLLDAFDLRRLIRREG
jgi:transcriptional regulator with XRE-family HTH domain